MTNVNSNKATQPLLFTEATVSPAGKAMVRVGNSESGQESPSQKKFNALAKKIEGLRRRIEETTRTYDGLLAYWAEELAPVYGEIAKEETLLAFALDRQANSFKLGVRQRATAGEVILDLLSDAFDLASPQDEALELFTRWNGMSIEEESTRWKAEMAEGLAEAMRDDLGIDIDAESLLEDGEDIRRLIEERLAAFEAETAEAPRKKTKKQLEKEESERLAQEFEQKSLRSLYLSLVKVIHPDAELDEAIKRRKEAIMKEVTAAYEARDIHSLLRLEMEWIKGEASNLGPLPEAKLKAYLSVLKEQVMDLEDELEGLRYSPRYEGLQDFLSENYIEAQARISRAARLEKKRVKILKNAVREWSVKLEKPVFVAKLRELVESAED